jgi:predicted RNase H-like nuclease (RuvC/YqgF family)
MIKMDFNDQDLEQLVDLIIDKIADKLKKIKEFENENSWLTYDNTKLKSEISNQNNVIYYYSSQVSDLRKENKKLKKELEEAEKEISFLHEELNKSEYQ